MSKKIANASLVRVRPFLKWAGGKSRVLDHIHSVLPKGKRLIEPFVGSGAVFLNTDYDRYILNDINPDLINLYQLLQREGEDFIAFCQPFFTPKNNQEKQYYRLRDQFNTSSDVAEKAALFIYLNRHGYNGLCRYNASKREFNTPFGRYQHPSFPAESMRQFHQQAQNATFTCQDFKTVMKKARKGDVIYGDPPYVPLSQTASFRKYSPDNFDKADQEALAALATRLSGRGVPVLLSNHNTLFTKEIYQGAEIKTFPVQRMISCKGGKRGKAAELLALFQS